MRLPSLSVVLVAYRSLGDLKRCLPSLYRAADTQTLGGALEVIVVLNGPDDGAAAWLGRHYPAVKVLLEPTNPGYAGGNNRGLAAATGEFVLVLNPDTEVLPGALGRLVATARRHPDALLTAKLLQPDGTLNACGLQMHYTGISSCRGLGEPATAYAGVQPVPLLSGAALLAPKRVWDALGGFADYFMYFEDVELSLRAKARGYRLFCVGDAHVTHHYAPSLSPEKFYFLERNRLRTLARLYEARTLRRLLPALGLTELLTWGFALLKGPHYLAAHARVYGWLWRHRAGLRLERRALQAARTVADPDVLAGSLAELPFEQLVRGRALARSLAAATRPLYARAPAAEFLR